MTARRFTRTAAWGGLAFGAFMAGASAPATATIAFADAQTFGVGGTPFSLAAADLNGDGKPDVAVANSTAGTVSVLLGNGDGTFGSQTAYGVGSYGPYSVAIGDLNGDGKMDLAVANGDNDGTVSVLLGMGNGTFGTTVKYVTGVNPHSVALGDVNGDGKPDLVVANAYDNTVSVLLGNGNGTFQLQVSYPTGAAPAGVVMADFNGDGKPDLAVADYGSAAASVLLGNGNGTFATQVTYGTGVYPVAVAVGRFNADNIVDLVVVNNGSNTISVLLGTGDGTFQAQGTYTSGAGPRSVAVADFSGDGTLDLAVTNSTDGTVSVLAGNGDGTFQAQLVYATITTGPYPVWVSAADLNADGKPDLTMANGNVNGLVAARLNSTGQFSFDIFTNSFEAGVGNCSPTAITAAHFATLPAQSIDGQAICIPPSTYEDPVYGTFTTCQTSTCGSNVAGCPTVLRAQAGTLSGLLFTGAYSIDTPVQADPTPVPVTFVGLSCTVDVSGISGRIVPTYSVQPAQPVGAYVYAMPSDPVNSLTATPSGCGVFGALLPFVFDQIRGQIAAGIEAGAYTRMQLVGVGQTICPAP